MILPCQDLNLGPQRSHVHEADGIPLCPSASIMFMFLALHTSSPSLICSGMHLLIACNYKFFSFE